MTEKELLTPDNVERQREAENLRRVAFCGVAISTVATMVCVLSVPMIYNYLQQMQSMMQNEVEFCRSRSSNIWREVTRTQVFNFFIYFTDDTRQLSGEVISCTFSKKS